MTDKSGKHQNKVCKAIIPAAGNGIRMLPITHVIPKPMLPILEFPSIHYVVEEFVNSGITNIVIVIKHNDTTTPEYFHSLDKTLKLLEKLGKQETLNRIRPIVDNANITFVPQIAELPVGTGSAVLSAKKAINNDNFMLGWSDIITVSDTLVARAIIHEFESNDCDGVIATYKVPKDQIKNTGIVEFKDNKNRNIVKQIIEKPDPKQNLSNTSAFGRYAFSPKIFEYMNITTLSEDREFRFTDVINKFAREHLIITKPVTGQIYSVGTPDEICKAVVDISKNRFSIS